MSKLKMAGYAILGLLTLGAFADSFGLGLAFSGLVIGITSIWHAVAKKSFLTPVVGGLKRPALSAGLVGLAMIIAGGFLAPPTATQAASGEATASPPPPSPTQTPSATLSPKPSPTPTPTPTPTKRAALLDSSGQPETALNVLAKLRIKGRAQANDYDRNLFGQRWLDTDRNGCDTRNDILRRDLSDLVIKPGTNDCVAESGTLFDPFTGQKIAFVRGEDTSEAVQIDHVVALSDAWQKGARQWDDALRAEFANDPLNLLAVDGPSNQQKGDGDAATWLPPNKPFRCQYVARQVAVKYKYDLWMTAAERDAIAAILQGCPEQRIPLDADRAWDPSVMPTPTPTPEEVAVPNDGGGTAPEEQGGNPDWGSHEQPAEPEPVYGEPAPEPAPVQEDVFYQNCSEAKAAGAAPLYRGEPGYRPKLDRDGDGVACER
ncbi:DUF1524 domain-containing protein [Buchananella felis]|uniref:GmrSD restriction endonuclease domain-containing protein n=1 Tax=Buchananella felis TaxID=3231492 RepID=UPI00352847C0